MQQSVFEEESTDLFTEFSLHCKERNVEATLARWEMS
jgi:hypothetical protein